MNISVCTFRLEEPFHLYESKKSIDNAPPDNTRNKNETPEDQLAGWIVAEEESGAARKNPLAAITQNREFLKSIEV